MSQFLEFYELSVEFVRHHVAITFDAVISSPLNAVVFMLPPMIK